MKKTFLLFSLAIAAFTSNAQLTLPAGTTYTQNFDGIGSGAPAGWSVYSGASATSLGNIETFPTSTSYPPSVLRPDTASCIGAVNVGGFKNFASADVCHPGDDWCAAVPPSYTNRALGVRQVAPTNASHPNLDSGAAYVLQLANTTGDTAFSMTFKLQSLDSSSPRTTTWMVDYAIGSPTSFTPVPSSQITGTMTTGGNLFSNNPITVNFGSALNNKASSVYIRIVTLVFSSGSGSRASTAIDDLNLTWHRITAGVTNISAPSALSLTTIGAATSDKITMQYNAELEGNYTLSLYDITGRVSYTRIVNAQPGDQQLSLDGLHLAPGMYFAKMNNGNSSSVARVMVQ